MEPTAHVNMLTVPTRSSLGGRLVTSLVASDTSDPLGNWLVVDAGKTRVHQTTARELPAFYYRRNETNYRRDCALHRQSARRSGCP